MNFKDTTDALTDWFARCVEAIEHNPQEWASPRELVDDFVALGIKHRGADIRNFSREERLKFQIALAKHMTFFADCKLFRTKSKPRTEAVEGRISTLPEQGYQLSAFGKQLANSGALKKKYYLGAMYALNKIKSIFRR